MSYFFQVSLRTIGVDAARAFYRSLFGDQPLQIFQLHEQAIARGARPHWLGYLHVDDVDRAASAFLARGALSLGPKWVNPEGLEAAVMRDPGGAVVALAKPPAGSGGELTSSAKPVNPEVAWYSLNTEHVVQAKVNYGECFGWEFKEPLDLGSVGVFHPFSFQPGQTEVGSMSDIATRPGVHPHWLFHFRVPALDSAMELILAAGGSFLPPFVQPNGERIVVCEDPQGAAFAIRQGGA